MRKVLNVKDIERMEKELAEAKGTDGYESLRDSYEGPDTGLDYDEDTGKLKIAEGWIADENGNIVPRDEVTGPGAE